MTHFSELVGKTIVSIKGGVGDEEIHITTDDGSIYRQYHSQDCCETVEVAEIHGNFNDILNDGPLMLAEETSQEATLDEVSESGTWTFYKLRTLNGDVTIRWLGESNGYYSEIAYFEKVS